MNPTSRDHPTTIVTVPTGGNASVPPAPPGTGGRRRRWTTPCLLVLLVWGGLRGEEPDPADDTIFFTNGHSLSGTILRLPDDENGNVTIRTPAGEISLPRSMVASMKMGYASRRHQLDPDDYEGHVALARWCLNEGMKQEAFDLLRAAADLREPDAEVVGLLGLLTDELLRSPQDALPYYRKYRDELGGDDPRILERLAELEEAEAAYQRALAAAKAKAEQYQPDEGMEVDAWVSESPKYYNPVRHQLVEVSADDNLVSNRVMRIRLQGGENYKGAIRRRISLDARRNPELVLHVLNPDKRRLPVSIAVKTGEDWIYFESRPQSVPANNQWVELRFDLRANTYKSAASKWVHRVGIGTPEDIRELQIQFHNRNRDAVVHLDGIGFPSATPAATEEAEGPEAEEAEEPGAGDDPAP